MKAMTYRSNGKLLLSGEYAVLDGAKALAIPTRYGQTLEVVPTKESILHWKSLRSDGSIWFEETFQLPSFTFKKKSPEHTTIATQLVRLLRIAQALNPSFLQQEGAMVTTALGFPQTWGLGSSSTLINNLAQWAEINPYTLLWKGFGGSGYDIAAAAAKGPITYSVENQKPKVQKSPLPWDFTEHLYFVHLNKKQNSRNAIEKYRKQPSSEETIKKISQLTNELTRCTKFAVFAALLQEHEAIMGQVLNEAPVQSRLFSDFSGTVKSLGAWGGDFVFVASVDPPQNYFQLKGYNTVIPFSEMIYKKTP